MKIGFANIYSFRPHPEHLSFLATLMQRAGHQAFFLTCDAGVSNCYPRMIKGTSKLKECPKCMLGGLRSYPLSPMTSISASAPPAAPALDAATLDRIALSSACTVNRTETDAEWNAPQVVAVRQSLYRPIEVVYQSTLRWIRHNRLDAVICFNGRMALPRAVTEACEQAGIPYLTHERTWFGDGLHLVPNANCLSIAEVNRMSRDFADRPLTLAQAQLAAKLVSERFVQRNSLEWRVYNPNPEPTPWPLAAPGPRVLVLPSSRNEFAGQPEWRSGWGDNTDALDDFFGAFAIRPEQVVVRCHPNWAEKIGQSIGTPSSDLYRAWTARRGIHCIASDQRASTYDLIQQADLVVMNGGSAAVEAGVCGKQIVCLGPVNYESAGSVRVFRDRDALLRPDAQTPLDPDMVIRKTLRFLYLSARRFPQFVDQVRAISTTRYEYFEGASAERIVAMLKTGRLEPDDASYASDTAGEDTVVDALRRKEWARLADYVPARPNLARLAIERRAGLRWVDGLREKFPKGDQG